MRVCTITGFTLLALAGLGGCGDGSAVETRDRARASTAAATLTAAAADGASAVADAEPNAAGLTANRRETVDDKVLRLYTRNGEDFGARSAEEFLDKITAFTTRPPEGTETVGRPNGDTLMYEAATNTFAVVSRDGTPRTMFKPDGGAAYWAEQKAAAPTFGQARPG